MTINTISRALDDVKLEYAMTLNFLLLFIKRQVFGRISFVG